MINLSNASRLYTDAELLGLVAKYVYTNGYENEKLDNAIDMASKMLGYDSDFIRGYIRQTIQDLEK
jgi:hypothetical protein